MSSWSPNPMAPPKTVQLRCQPRSPLHAEASEDDLKGAIIVPLPWKPASGAGDGSRRAAITAGPGVAARLERAAALSAESPPSAFMAAAHPAHPGRSAPTTATATFTPSCTKVSSRAAFRPLARSSPRAALAAAKTPEATETVIPCFWSSARASFKPLNAYIADIAALAAAKALETPPAAVRACAGAGAPAPATETSNGGATAKKNERPMGI